jgi:type I restriction enzyme S subunit
MDVKEAPAVYRLVGDAPPAEEGVPAGYKRTEVGVIPEDWDAVPLGKTARGIYRGASPRPIDDPIWFDEKSSIGWVRISDVTRSNRYLQDTTQYLSQRGVQSSRYLARGALIMSICATVGRPIKTSLDVCIHDGFVVFDRPSVDQDFLYFVLADLEPRWSSKGQTGSQMNLNTGLIKGTEVAMPGRMAEQRAIAEALSDADTLIESLQQLIAKKRALKQGTMQELLTGRQRLPGCSDTWKPHRLDEFGSVYGGLSGKTKRDFGHGSSRFVTFMGVMTGVIVDMTRTEPVDVASSESQNAVLRGDMLFNGSSETPQEIGLCAVVDEQVDGVYLNSFCFGFRPHTDAPIDPLYLAYFYRSDAGRQLLAPLAQGAIRYNLSKRALLELEFDLPSKEEQTAIATVLSDMDAEIDALEARLAKTRDLKAGMMQALLTGRIRLPLEQPV